jgi:hypothetical protein
MPATLRPTFAELRRAYAATLLRNPPGVDLERPTRQARAAAMRVALRARAPAATAAFRASARAEIARRPPSAEEVARREAEAASLAARLRARQESRRLAEEARRAAEAPGFSTLCQAAAAIVLGLPATATSEEILRVASSRPEIMATAREILAARREQARGEARARSFALHMEGLAAIVRLMKEGRVWTCRAAADPLEWPDHKLWRRAFGSPVRGRLRSPGRIRDELQRRARPTGSAEALAALLLRDLGEVSGDPAAAARALEAERLRLFELEPEASS